MSCTVGYCWQVVFILININVLDCTYCMHFLAWCSALILPVQLSYCMYSGNCSFFSSRPYLDSVLIAITQTISMHFTVAL